jgi:hypothetical protein
MTIPGFTEVFATGAYAVVPAAPVVPPFVVTETDCAPSTVATISQSILVALVTATFDTVNPAETFTVAPAMKFVPVINIRCLMPTNKIPGPPL